MSNITSMPVTERRTSQLQTLIGLWYETDPLLEDVVHFELPDSTDRHVSVLLLQITEATPQSPDEVVVYGFAPSQEFPFPLALAQVTPKEWKDIQSNDLALPSGWLLENARSVPRRE